MIQRAYRRKKLLKAVRLMQRIVRGKLGQRSSLRKRLEVCAMERARANREFIVVERSMKEISLDTNWMRDEEQVPVSYTYCIPDINLLSICLCNLILTCSLNGPVCRCVSADSPGAFIMPIQVPPISMADHMRRLDIYCLSVLTANPLQLSMEEYPTIHPAEFGEDDYADKAVRCAIICS